MKARTITLTDADVRELEWLRGGLHALTLALRMLNGALAEGASLKQATGLPDLAGLLLLVAAMEDCETLDTLLEDSPEVPK